MDSISRRLAWEDRQDSDDEHDAELSNNNNNDNNNSSSSSAVQTPAESGAGALGGEINNDEEGGDSVPRQRTSSLNVKTNGMKAAKTSPSPAVDAPIKSDAVSHEASELFAVPEGADESSAAAPSFPKQIREAPPAVLPDEIFTTIVGMARTKILSDPVMLQQFLERPAPQGHNIQCRILRHRDGVEKLYPEYELFLEEPSNTGTFLLAARKRKKSRTANYIITSSRNVQLKDNDTVRGKVRANFIGTAFTVYDSGRNPFKSTNFGSRGNLASPVLPEDQKLRKEIASIIYEQNILGLKGPRKMTILLPGMTRQSTAIEIRPETESDTILERYKNKNDRELLVLHNKQPQWNEETRSFVLNFNGRVTMASVKNFQIAHDQDLDYITLQFGRNGEDTFTLDYRYPMNALQAFGIAMSSFAGKLACE